MNVSGESKMITVVVPVLVIYRLEHFSQFVKILFIKLFRIHGYQCISVVVGHQFSKVGS